MSMCYEHINTHRNPGADVDGIIAYLFPFYKRCQNFLKFFGILNPFLQKRVKPPEAFSWRLVDSVCLIQTGVCVFVAHVPGFSFYIIAKDVNLLSDPSRCNFTVK